jgi:hypothetical protein
MWLALLPNPVETTWQILLAVGVGLACLALLAAMRRRPARTAPVEELPKVSVA